MIIQLPKGAKRLVKLALGHKSHQYIDLIDLWLRESGPEWTVNRLKAIRSGAYQLRAGNPEIAKGIWQSNSISYHKGSLIPKGITGEVVRHYVTAQRGKYIRKYDALLRVYTCIYNHTLTHTQFAKAKAAITNGYQGNSVFLDKLCEQFDRYSQIVMEHYYRKFSKLMEDPDYRLKVDLSRMSMTSATHTESHHPSDIKSMPWGRHVASLWTSGYLPESLQRLNPASEIYNEFVKSGIETTVAGHIAFIQEGGCKARVVAVPNVWIQLHMMRLDDILDRIIPTYPESCSHEQNKGAYFMRDNILRGNKLFCFDLSSATDRFPLKLQTILLNNLGLQPFSDAISEIAKAPWRVQCTVQGEAVDEFWSYGVGQPMGMYSSFKLFHLTHLLLVKMWEYHYGVRDTFRILGDDIVISDPKVAKAYAKTLAQMGVEISRAKSVLSRTLGEFAGFVCTKTNKGAVVHRPFKYSGAHGFGAAIPMLYAFGSSVKNLGQWYENKYRDFVHTLSWRNPDLSPLIHSDKDDTHGGSRLNSHLLGSMSNRFSYSIDYYPSNDLLEIYEEQQIILLGQKEKVNASGFASADDNVAIAPGKDLNSLTEASVQPTNVWSTQVSSDPLMKDQIKLRNSSIFSDLE